jgi:hypothetical protein
MFFCYDCQQRRLYLSDPTRRAFVKQYIGNSTVCPVSIKPIVASMDEFIRHLHTLQTISFTQESNLYTQIPGEIFDRQVNALGLDLPQRMKVKLEYASLPIGNARLVLQKLESSQKAAQFENIVAVGIDDKGIEQAFDFQSVLSSIDVEGEKDSNGHYDNADIRKKIIMQIEKVGKPNV